MYIHTTWQLVYKVLGGSDPKRAPDSLQLTVKVCRVELLHKMLLAASLRGDEYA